MVNPKERKPRTRVAKTKTFSGRVLEFVSHLTKPFPNFDHLTAAGHVAEEK